MPQLSPQAFKLLHVNSRCLQQRTASPIIEPEGGIILMLNENLKAVRHSRGLSQQELAVKLNVVRQTISKWEKGVSHS